MNVHPISNSGAADKETPWLYRYTIHAMMMIQCGVFRFGKLFRTPVKSLPPLFVLRGVKKKFDLKMRLQKKHQHRQSSLLKIEHNAK
jgi:hypothetical protein